MNVGVAPLPNSASARSLVTNTVMDLPNIPKQSIGFETPKQLETILNHADFFRLDASQKLNPDRRSEMGQFFTPLPVARLMASMFSKRPQIINLLDAGAGVGSLTAACIAEVCRWEEKPRSVNITVYEVEPILVDYLHKTLQA